MREPEILVEQQPPQGVLVCDHAGLVINKFSQVLALVKCDWSNQVLAHAGVHARRPPRHIRQERPLGPEQVRPTQPRGKSIAYLVHSHTNATIIGWHLWEIDLRFALKVRRGRGRAIHHLLPRENGGDGERRKVRGFVRPARQDPTPSTSSSSLLSLQVLEGP